MDVSEVAGAIRMVKTFANNTTKSLAQIEKSLGGMQGSLEKVASHYKKTSSAAQAAAQKESAAAQKTADLVDRKSNAIARASERIRNMEQKVKSSNASQEVQTRLIGRLKSELQAYADNVKSGTMRATEMDNANTELSTSLGYVQRQLKDSTKATSESSRQQVANIKSLGQLQVSYDRTTNAVQRSELADENKKRTLQELDRLAIRAQRAVKQYGTASREAAQAQTEFRAASARATIAARNANAEFRKKDASYFSAQLKDLTNSVQLALGPLSGVASRVTALAGLFGRNAVSIAGLFAGITGLTVGFTKAAQAATKAEAQLLALNGIVGSLGDNAAMTGRELFDLGTEVGKAFLTSAGEARAAAGALATFGGIGRSQFKDVLTAAQGVSQVMGGTLKSNTIRLGRLLENPAENFDSLRRAGVNFTDEIRDQVKHLRDHGRVLEANRLILDQFSAVMKAAEEAPKGLAGALDTAGEMSNLFFENLFEVSGATTAATDEINKLSASFEKMIDSPFAKIVGGAFTLAIKGLGGAANLLAGSLNTVGVLLVGLAAASIPKVIVALGSMLGLTGANIKASLAYAKALVTVKGAATAAATTGLARLSAAMTAVPVVGLVLGISAITATLFSMKSAASNTSSKFGEAVDDMQRRVDKFRHLTDSEKQEFLAKSSDLEAEAMRMEDHVKDIEQKLKAARRSLESKVSANLLTAPTADAKKAIDEQKAAVQKLQVQLNKATTAFEELSKKPEELAKAAAELDDVNRSLGYSYDEVIKKASAMRREYMTEVVALEDLRKARATAIDNIKKLSSRTDDNSEATKKAITYYEQVVKALDEDIAAKEKAANKTKKLSRAYYSLVQNIDVAAASIRSLDAQLKQGADTAAIKNAFEIEKEVSKFSKTIETLSERDLNTLAAKLGVNAAALDTQKEKIRAVTAAYSEHMTEQMKVIFAKEREIEANREAQSIIEGSLTGLEAINQKYREQVASVMNASEAVRQHAIDVAAAERAKAVALAEAKMQDDQRFTPLNEVEQLKKDYDMRIAAAKEYYANDKAALDAHLSEMKKNYDSWNAHVQFAQNAQKASDVFGGALQAMQAAGKEQTKEYKMMALAQAAIAQGMAVSKAFSAGDTWTGMALAATMAASIGAQIKQIKAASYATGGYVSGPGTSTSDSVPANLSDGEFVMRASAVKKWGVNRLKAMNEGRAPIGLAEGGPVTPTLGAMNTRPATSSNTEVHVHFDGPQGTVEKKETVDSMGNKRLDVYVKTLVKQMHDRGEMDGTLGNNFGLTRKGRGR